MKGTNTKTLIFFTSLVIAVAFAWLVVLPEFQSVEGLQEDIESAERDLAALQEEKAAIEEEIEYFEGLSEEDKELVRKAIPEHAARPTMVSVLNNMIQANGLVANNVSAQKSGEGPQGTSIVESGLEVEGGSYQSVKDLGQSLQALLRVFDVQSINISRGAEGAEGVEGSSALTITINGRSYYLAN